MTQNEDLEYPELIPPDGWNGFRAGTQIRLLPPDTHPHEARLAIIVSPLLARSPQLPSPAELINKTIEAEVVSTGVELLDRGEPAAVKTDSGLDGISIEARIRGPTGIEKRIYVLYSDELCHYGINYLASEDAFEEQVAIFWKTARSIRPFEGRIVPKQLDGVFDHYGD